jgi:protein TonB
MTDPTPEPERATEPESPVPAPRGGTPPWSTLLLALFVVAAGIGVVLQLGAWRSQAVDRMPVANTRSTDAVPRTEPIAEEPRAPAPAPERVRSADRSLPEFGEFVHVDELPQPRTQIAPTYPPLARNAGIEGTVVVQALIGRDGVVKGTRVVKSVPELDEAALAAVEKWTFQPARSEGQPVAVWVAIPIRFKLD